MRASGSETISSTEQVSLTFEGKTVPARRGETIAAALAAAEVRDWRETRTGNRRGLYCGMGVCQDCLIVADDHPVRACMTRIDRPLALTCHRHPAAVPPADKAGAPLPPLVPEVLVIGAGIAGLAAALAAAEGGAKVMLLDERPASGGQFLKQLLASADLPFDRFADRQMRQGRRLIAAVRASAVEVISGAEVVAAFEPLDIVISRGGSSQLLRPQRLIVATGAYELPLAVPGWTLPGVVTTGALQTLLRSYRVIPGRRVLIAGNGPLNLQVALELARAGAEVVAVAEAAPPPWSSPLSVLWGMATASPRLARDGALMLAELKRRRVPVRYLSAPTRFAATTDGIAVTLRSPSRPDGEVMVADVVGMGYGFAPRGELFGLIGCRLRRDAVSGRAVAEVDEAGRTSVPAVFAAGDCLGLGGAPAAALTGTLAGRAAARDLRPRVEYTGADDMALRRELLRAQRFQKNLWTVYKPALSPPRPAAGETPVCRCEEVGSGELAALGPLPIGSLKRLTRAGMGRCQGRYCEGLAAATAAVVDAAMPPGWAPRPPVMPTTVGTFANLELADD